MLMVNKGGRPQSDNPKQSVLGVRVTAEEHERIKQYASLHHQTISQVVLEGLELLYNIEETRK
ncbi:MAG: CopG family transcriptional regulator [Anaerostipes sp.]